MSDQSAAIDYTFTDEAPALATYSLLPVVRICGRGRDWGDLMDISLSGRIIAGLS